VTGARGTVGRPLCEALADSHDVFRLDLQHETGTPPDYMRIDVGEFRQVDRAVTWARPDLVYHAAAEFGRINGNDFYEQLWKSNLVGTRNLLDLQKRNRFRLVFFSSSEVYGDYDGEMDEDVMETRPIQQLNDYAISKWASELQIKNEIRDHKVGIFTVRLFNTFGPWEYPNRYRSVIARWIYEAARSGELVVHRGPYRRTSLFSGDAVRVLARIPERWKPDTCPIVNIANPESMAIEEMAETVIRVVGKGTILRREVPLATTRQKKVSVHRMQKLLGPLEYTPFEEGIKKTYAWMREAGVAE